MNELLARLAKKRLLQEFYNKCHSPGNGRFCEDDSGKTPTVPEEEFKLLKRLDPDIAEPVQHMLHSRREVEPEYTDLLQDVAKEHGGEMLGLDFKFKKADGIVGKIDRKVKQKGLPPEEAAEDISDSLRYTSAFPHDQYVAGIQATIKALKSKGIEFESIENNWERGDAYNGVNAVFKDNKTGLKIELQFHTPESFHIKDVVIHKDYEFIREGKGTPAQRLLAHERMRQASDSQTFPKDVEGLTATLTKEGVKVSDLFRPFKEALLSLEKDSLLRF